MQRGADREVQEELVRKAAVWLWLPTFGNNSAHNWGLQKKTTLEETQPGGKFCINPWQAIASQGKLSSYGQT